MGLLVKAMYHHEKRDQNVENHRFMKIFVLLCKLRFGKVKFINKFQATTTTINKQKHVQENTSTIDKCI